MILKRFAIPILVINFIFMLIIQDINKIQRDENTFLTIGTFDGLHIAHKQIINKVIEKSKIENGRSVILTFEPHPRSILNGRKEIFLLLNLDEKLDILGKFDIDLLIVLKFDKDLSNMPADKFFEEIIINKIGIREIIVGYDHYFGKDRQGNIELLKNIQSRYNFSLSIIDPIRLNGEAVNSTSIRRKLLEGNIEYANKLLGRPYSLSGKVIKGDKRGEILGFPTANILSSDPLKLIPRNGVYLVKIYIDDNNYYGFLNIGTRPTFSESDQISIEVHVFDFNLNIYNKGVVIEFLYYIREEIKFTSSKELIAQMNLDKEKCLKIIKNI
jgi:riboflavin kinase/FMN adenylyltransferase